ncbi:MAG: carbohydrate-binding domain-containing protein [Butyrivibrio sp.]|nr:carbohydrate-binding domain-containing protein [Butyrivibrio sp.]
MKKKIVISILSLVVASGLILAGCSSVSSISTEDGTSSTSTSVETRENDSSSDTEVAETSTVTDTSTSTSTDTGELITPISDLTLDDMFSSRDLETGYDESSSTTITLSDAEISISGEGATADGTTLTITEAGTYIISGELSDGQIIIEADDTAKIQLVLNGVTITNDDSACILVKTADKVFVTLADGSVNTLSDTGVEYTQTDDTMSVDGVIFSKEDITFNGSGTLNINASYANGIVGKDDVVFTGGTYNIESTGNSIEGKDSVRIKDGTFNLTSGDGKDGIHTSNEEDAGKGFIYIEGGDITISSQDDGIHAGTALIIAGGTINVTESYEGLEGDTIDITGGTITVNASDDGLNASTSTSQDTDNASMEMGGMMEESDAYIRITDGEITVTAGGDGIDSNGDLYVDGGTTIVYGPTDSMNAALDYGDMNASAVITGGTFMAGGSSGMATTFTEDSTQYSIMYGFESTVSAGTEIVLTDSEGNEILTYTSDKDLQNIILSSADITEGEYTITAGDQTDTITVESVSTTAGNTTGGFGGGGQMGGGPGQGGQGFGKGQGEMPTDGEAPSGEMPTDGQMPSGGKGPMGNMQSEDQSTETTETTESTDTSNNA